MIGRVANFARRIGKEPPFRLFTRLCVKYGGGSMRSKAWWDAVERPHYLTGILRATDHAKIDGIDEVCVAEFGVARGVGLLCLQAYAEAVERETGIKVWVVGFDCGSGLPELCGDYRDHPDLYIAGDYPMDEAALRAKLTSRTELIIGDVKDTVPDFVANRQKAPIGFAAIDTDLFTSTRDAFKIFSLPKKKMLKRAILYIDDIDLDYYHRFAGEFLAIDDFNATNPDVKIDVWHGIRKNRPFPEQGWLDQMYVVHDLAAISRVKPMQRAPNVIGDMGDPRLEVGLDR